LLVVSSDHRLHKAARRRKARVRDSDKFLDACEAAERRASQADEPPEERSSAKLSPEEVAAWVREFGNVDLAELRSAPQAPSGEDSAPPQPPGTIPTRPPPATPDELAFWQKRLADVLDVPPGRKAAP
jgi:hypothetical protein